jgi:hypothetical protein
MDHATDGTALIDPMRTLPAARHQRLNPHCTAAATPRSLAFASAGDKNQCVT